MTTRTGKEILAGIQAKKAEKAAEEKHLKDVADFCANFSAIILHNKIPMEIAAPATLKLAARYWAASEQLDQDIIDEFTDELKTAREEFREQLIIKPKAGDFQ